MHYFIHFHSQLLPIFTAMKKAGSILLNKYVLAIGFFVVWMLFFDQRNYFDQKEQRDKLHKLEEKKAYYQSEIDKARKELSDIQNSPAALEKLAREKYFMKKPGEDIYIVEDSSTQDSNN